MRSRSGRRCRADGPSRARRRSALWSSAAGTLAWSSLPIWRAGVAPTARRARLRSRCLSSTAPTRCSTPPSRTAVRRPSRASRASACTRCSTRPSRRCQRTPSHSARRRAARRGTPSALMWCCGPRGRGPIGCSPRSACRSTREVEYARTASCGSLRSTARWWTGSTPWGTPPPAASVRMLSAARRPLLKPQCSRLTTWRGI
mmetsp:Transcript_24785/g.59862  ORF Transcript_24785/g.59862 Transcript_24785/m.59862 type:complete len:202 (+) Transcript_24785:1060-1665(+)